MIEFTPQDKSALANWLSEGEYANSAMSMDQLEGFLFALVCAPLPISEEVWVDQALAGDISMLAEDKLFALMAFHNVISEQVFEKGYRLSESIAFDKKAQNNLTNDAPLHHWAVGFSQGIQHYIEPIIDAKQLSSDINEALAMTLGYLSFFANLDNDKTLCEDVMVLLDDFTQGFAGLIEASFLDAGLAQDGEAVELFD
jgi:uncharacterized protein YecA (UPF0149 family)